MSDGTDEYVVPDEGVQAESTAWVNPDPKTCPVIPLGFIGKDVVFALPEGEVRREPAYRVPTMLRADIYASIEGTKFLANWRDHEGKVQLATAGQWLVRLCRAQGYWDVSRPQRGYGVWPSDKGPVVHAGDAVGRWPSKTEDWRSVAEALKEDSGGPIWLLRPRAPRPETAASRTDVQALRDGLDLWGFSPLGDGGLSEADVVFGHLGVALLGAVPRFRPTLNVIGGAGTGKTTLSRYVQALASANAGDLLDAFTDAGPRQSLAGEARGLYLDEAEPSEDGQPGPIERALEILRRMATGEGSAGRQGSIHGGPAATSAVGCSYLASINPLAPGDAMASRMVAVRLRPLGKAKGEMDDKLQAMIEAARKASPSLLARAVRDASRFRSDVAMLKTALGEKGLGQRGADQFATIAAGRRLLLFDEALSLDEACDEVDAWAALVRGKEAASTTQNQGQACLSRIWAINSGQHNKDRHLTIGELVLEEAGSPGFHEKVLKSWGLKVENGHADSDRPGPWLIISNNHPLLARALHGTAFVNWRGVLEHLADLGDRYAPHPMPKPVRFHMHQSRALAIPLAPWMDRPVAVGVDPKDDPSAPADWGAASRDSSQPASQGEAYD